MSETLTTSDGTVYDVLGKTPTVNPECPEKEEPKSTFKLNRKQRIKLFRLKQALGYLPKKPEGKIVGKHEYIRLEESVTPYFVKVEDKDVFNPSKLDEKLKELADRKVLGITKEWGGYTIKVMAQRQ